MQVNGEQSQSNKEGRHSRRSSLNRVKKEVHNHYTHQTFHKITIYETKTRLYLVGSNLSDKYRIMKIDRTCPTELNITLDDVDYTANQCEELLLRIHLGNQHIGGLNRVLSCFGLVGFVKFTKGYYMCLITKRKAIATIGGSYIYHIEDTTLLDISGPFHKMESKSDEERYLNIFQNVDLSKNFYFSYTYNLTQSLQLNVHNLKYNKGINYFQSRFVWNHYLLKNGFGKDCLNKPSPWILPLIHGFMDQARISILGKTIYVTLIARRSRYFAGARFLKRGGNEKGHVANEVETEQIVNDTTTTSLIDQNGNISPNYTSYLQHRGSIPLSWGQDISSMAPKPPINILKADPFANMASKHFDDLFLRYGAPLIILNLIKKKEKTPRESKVLKEFTNAVEYLQSTLTDSNKLFYIDWDMSNASKSADEDVIGYLEWLGDDALNETQFFHSGKEPYAWELKRLNEGIKQSQYESLLQHGIVRTNCIDCIDRTNAAQFLIGKCALAYQLHSLGIIMECYLPFDCYAIDMLTEMYHDHGDTLALQYGGSNLVNTMATYRNTNRNWSSHSRDIVEAIRRFYTNSFVDADKQDAMNLFLGMYVVGNNLPKLWNLPTDYYLHNPPNTNFKAPKYIEWYSDKELLNTSRNLPLNMIIDNQVNNTNVEKGKKKAKKYPLYWLEYYRPRQFTSFSRLLAYNLNGTDFIRNNTLEFDHQYNDNNKTLSPFVVHSNINKTNENENDINVVRFGKWFSLTGGKTKAKDPKQRRSNILPTKEKEDVKDNEDMKERKELLAVPKSEIKTLIHNLLEPTPPKKDLDMYDGYLNNDYSQFNNLDINDSYYNNILSNNDTLDSSEIHQYEVYINLLGQFQNNFKMENYKNTWDAYSNYLRHGKFKLPKPINTNNITPYSTISKY